MSSLRFTARCRRGTPLHQATRRQEPHLDRERRHFGISTPQPVSTLGCQPHLQRHVLGDDNNNDNDNDERQQQPRTPSQPPHPSQNQQCWDISQTIKRTDCTLRTNERTNEHEHQQHKNATTAITQPQSASPSARQPHVQTNKQPATQQR